jgi:hypothetical protein
MVVFKSSILEQRGIDAAAVVGQWSDHDITWKPKGETEAAKIPGWIYPLWESDGRVFEGVKRWKSAAPETKTPSGKSTPKYLWLPGKAPRPDFYILPGTFQGVEKHGGKLAILGGEPDVLVAQMAGIPALCWFGEGALPDDLAVKLIALGAREISYYFDNDESGLESARLVNEALQDSDLVYSPRCLPGNEKADFNTVWIDSDFDRSEFFGILQAIEIDKRALEPSKKARREKAQQIKRKLKRKSESFDRWADEIQAKAIAKWGISEMSEDERSVSHFPCPGHNDSDPSAQWNYRTRGFHCFGACGRDFNTKEVARLLGEPEYSPPPKRVQTPRQQTRQPTKKPQLEYVTSTEAIKELRLITNGQASKDLPPIPCPYEPVRRFRGLLGLWDRKKIIAVLGGSGLGKTAFVMTIADMLRQNGYDIFVLGREWSPVNYTMRGVARAGGPSYDDQRYSRIWYSMTESDRRKIDDKKIRPLSKEDQARVNQILDTMELWPGRYYYLGSQPYTTTMRLVPDACKFLREKGRNPAVFILDYAQKERQAGGSWASAVEDVAVVLSQTIERANLAGLLVSQVSKSEARSIRENAGGLDSLAGMGLSDHLVQGSIVLQPHFEDRADIDGTKVKVRIDRATIYKVKDNSGTVPMRVTVRTNLARHQYTEEIIGG